MLGQVLRVYVFGRGGVGLQLLFRLGGDDLARFALCSLPLVFVDNLTLTHPSRASDCLGFTGRDKTPA